MNKPNVRMWAKFALSPQSGATPKYVLTDAYGWVEELKDLVGRDGYISLYLQKRREGQPSDAPAMYLQAKGSINFTFPSILQICVNIYHILNNKC